MCYFRAKDGKRTDKGGVEYPLPAAFSEVSIAQGWTWMCSSGLVSARVYEELGRSGMAREGRMDKRWIAKHECIFRYETGYAKNGKVIFCIANPGLSSLFPTHHGLVQIHRLPSPHTLSAASDRFSELRGPESERGE
jgi:hypothetical protein